MKQPVKDYDRSRRYPETWLAMEQLVGTGKARSIARKNATPLFIVASTICLFVVDEDFDEVKRMKIILQDQQHDDTLAEMCQKVLEQLIINKRVEERDEILRDFHRIVGSIVLFYDPLSVSLASLLDVEAGLIERRLKLLRSVLVIPDKKDVDGTIKPLHLSFRDFLTSQSKTDANSFKIDTTETNHSLTAGCLRVMSDQTSGLRKNICKLENDGILQSEIRDTHSYIKPELKYAFRFWVRHLENGKPLVDDDGIYTFFEKHFLHWLEVMSILGLIDEALAHLASLQELLSVSNLLYAD
ncbi:hypothetical protein N7493_000517 [Penicillium malachiteum]|uniref:Uncharacterized protein n=1 Tax=Penicillium malachiteum TaxID=1324776 RepID=A0AAD6HWL7_9EURO|nr:hypothetical protein N7493_000517 [Penicillium malachiteum]